MSYKLGMQKSHFEESPFHREKNSTETEFTRQSNTDKDPVAVNIREEELQ